MIASHSIRVSAATCYLLFSRLVTAVAIVLLARITPAAADTGQWTNM